MEDIRLEEPAAPPIFLLSCERSGSTLLRYLIDTHSSICCPGELVLGMVCTSLRTALSRTLGRAAVAQHVGEEAAIKQTRRIVSGIMNAYARAKGKDMWCDKTPWNLTYLESLVEVFPDAKFICLYRNCLDVVNSCLENSRFGYMSELAQYAAQNPHNLVSAMAESWLEKTTKLLRFELQNKCQCFRIKYESLVTDTEQTLQALFKFLGVTWEPDIVVKAFQIHHDQGGGDTKISVTTQLSRQSIGTGAAIPICHLSQHQFRRIAEILVELEYPELNYMAAVSAEHQMTVSD
jgi:protein-tyrosine sulfotransferase